MASQSPMYRAFVEVVPEASGFTGALTGQVTSAGAAAGAAGGKVAGGGFVAGFGKVLPLLGTAIAAFSIGDAISDSITNGSNLEQARGAIEQIYGGLGSDAITAFAEGGAKTLGQSMNDVLGSASLLGVFGKAAGLADGDLVDFSETLITLGSDLSAFAGTTPDQAVQALTAGLRGESEPLRQYGVLLDDAALKARAMEMGIYDGNGPLTQQQRILAAYNEIMAQTTDQQGQFGRESDTLAGKQAVMAASFENISSRVGEAFLPVFAEFADLFIERGIPALEEFAGWLNDPKTQEYIGKWVLGLQQISDFVGTMSEKFDLGAQQIQGFFEVVGEKFALGAEQIGGFFSAVFGWFQDVANRLAEGQQQVFDFFGAIGGKFAEGAEQIGSWVGSVGEGIGQVIGWFGELPGRISGAFAGIGGLLYNSGAALIGGFLDGMESMWGTITDTVGGIIDFVAGFFPNSPAKHGPLSGAGWTKLGKSGVAIGDQFAGGITASYRAVQGAVSGLTSAAIPGDTYVQNPFTGDYLLAQVANVAQKVSSSASMGRALSIQNGRTV